MGCRRPTHGKPHCAVRRIDQTRLDLPHWRGDLTESQFRARLAALGLTLDATAFAAAWTGAQNLQAEVAKVTAYLNTDKP